MPRSEVWDDSNGSPLIKYEKHWQKHSSTLRCCIPVYSELPKYLIWRLQRNKNTVADYVIVEYAKESDFITTLGWLPVQELMEFAIVKCTFSALNDPKWLKYVPIKFQEKNAQYVLKTKYVWTWWKKIHLVIKHMIYLTIYQKQWVIKDKKVFIKETERYRDKALARALISLISN